MELLERIKRTAEEDPLKFSSAIFLLLFWLLTPSAMQYFYNISAINVSFAIIVFYYVGFKLYQFSKKKSREPSD